MTDAITKLPKYGIRAVQALLTVLVVYYWMVAESSTQLLRIQAAGIRSLSALAVIIALEVVIVRAIAGWGE